MGMLSYSVYRWRTLDEDSDPELLQPLSSFVVYVWNLRGNNFCNDHPVLLVFGKSATPMQFSRFPA